MSKAVKEIYVDIQKRLRSTRTYPLSLSTPVKVFLIAERLPMTLKFSVCFY